MSSWTRAAAVVKPTDIPLWQAARPRPRAMWVLPAPLLPTAMMFSRRSMYSQRASSMTSCFVHRGDGQEVEGVQAFDRGEARGADPALYHALVAVDEFQFGQPEQVVRVISAFLGAPDGQLAVLPLEGGQLQFLEVMLQEQR